MYSCLSHFGLYINICMTRVKSSLSSSGTKNLEYDTTSLTEKHMLWAFSSIYLFAYVYICPWYFGWHSPNATKVSIMTIRFAQCFNLAEHRIDIDLRNAFLGCYSSDWYLISWFRNSPQCCATFVYFQNLGAMLIAY